MTTTQDMYKTGRLSMHNRSKPAAVLWACLAWHITLLPVSKSGIPSFRTEIPWRQPVSGTVSWLSLVNSAHPTLEGRLVDQGVGPTRSK